jgi:hypothetical protein
VTFDGELRIYYGGSNGKHTGWRDGFLCLATLRPDGWAGYETTGDQPGKIITTAIDVAGSTLRLSADIAEGGSIRVAVIGDPDRTLAACRPVTEDVTDGGIAWDGAKLLGAGRVALQFELKNAKLYSFSFAR